MMRLFRGWIWLYAATAVTLCFGQPATTFLRGSIRDQSGALVSGAKVTITDKGTGKSISTFTGDAGQYSFFQITPSKYVVAVRAVGFGEQMKSAELLVNQPANIDFWLAVQASPVTVDVSDVVQTLNTFDASIGNSANSELIEALPSETRNVADFLSLQPGVLYLPTNDSRNGAVNGGRSDQGNVTLDGIDDNDAINGYAFFGVLRETQDSIQEFREVTSNANADAGRSSGSQISMVTKSGTNEYHGAAYEYYRPPLTAANNWFNKQAQLNQNMPNVPAKVLRNIFGAAFAGPIKKGRAFFFGNFEALREADDAEVIQTVATQTYASGSLVYSDTSGNLQTLTRADVVALDAGCQICNTTEYPNSPGPNPNALAYFKSMPTANGTLTGDGYDRGSYLFASPNPLNSNTSIARFDFTPSGRHRIFARGQIQKDTALGPEQFPGQGASSVGKSNNKGIITGETWTISPNLINDVRYGYIRRGFSSTGAGKGEYVDFYSMSAPTSESRTYFGNEPVNNVVDNLSWTKRKHTFEFGGVWRLIHHNYSSDYTWNSATTNPFFLAGYMPDPSSIGAPPIDPGFQNSYEIAFANLVGSISQTTQTFTYQINGPTSGTALPEGSFIPRHFKANEFEWYAQDSWRLKSNLTMTLGLRHSILQTPYETRGQQVTPTINTHDWFLRREAAAQQGLVYEPDLEFAPSGPAHRKPGFWPTSKNNFAPRIAIAYSPTAKTSIRAGAGIYYDHYGEALVSLFDQAGSFGMSSSISDPAGTYSIEGSDGFLPAPRLRSRTTVPSISIGSTPALQTFPYTPATSSFAITWGLDSEVKTPYSEVLDLSIQRELPGGFTFEAAYVGRMGRRLLQQVDLAEPVDYVDPKGGGDYYAAATQLSKAVDQNQGDPNALVQPIQYFEDVFPFMTGFDYAGESATQSIYSYEWAPSRSRLGATMALANLDFYCAHRCPSDWSPHFWQGQFSSLYAWSSIGKSYYNAGQFTLRHPMSHGLHLDFSYTLSNSIDWGSDTERSMEFSGAFSEIMNTWKPYLNRGVSDFDTRHLITADWIYGLPFGRGKSVASAPNRIVDTFVSGWQLSGITRWSSGLPFSLIDPGWSTDWQIESFSVATGPVKIRKHLDANGNPQYFEDAVGINKGVASGGPMRLSYPGEAGQRNKFRGDGLFNVDSGVAKHWKVGESGTLRFSWEVYNITNAVRFDPASISNQLTAGNLGVPTGLLTVPRRMQFSLRYEF